MGQGKGRETQWVQVFRYGVSLFQGRRPPNGAAEPCLTLSLPLKSPSLSFSMYSRLLRVPSFVRFRPFTEFFTIQYNT